MPDLIRVSGQEVIKLIVKLVGAFQERGQALPEIRRFYLCH